MKIQPLRHCLQELLHHESSWTEDAERELETLYAKLNEAIDGLPALKEIIDKRRREIAMDMENRKKAGFKIDPETADVTFNWGDISDPYGHFPGTAECIGRNYFARSHGWSLAICRIQPVNVCGQESTPATSTKLIIWQTSFDQDAVEGNDHKRVFARMMEAYARALGHADRHRGD
jgi:hypothetical protein